MTYLNQVAAFYDVEMSLSGALDTTAQLFQAKHDWAVKNIATIKNVFYDVTGGKIGSNEPPPELSIKNVFDPKSNQISKNLSTVGTIPGSSNSQNIWLILK